MADPESDAYRRGLIEGRMSAMEDRHTKLEGRIDGHEQRLTAQERITFAMLGAFALIQVWPTISRMLGG